jgi:hypothetical protein
MRGGENRSGGGIVDEASSWHAFDQGQSIGTSGSEGGVILRDEEHDAGARITLERDTRVAPSAITCGLYGWFFHTCFFGSPAEAGKTCDEMKIEMQKIIDLISDVVDGKEGAEGRVYGSISEFVERFPT